MDECIVCDSVLTDEDILRQLFLCDADGNVAVSVQVPLPE